MSTLRSPPRLNPAEQAWLLEFLMGHPGKHFKALALWKRAAEAGHGRLTFAEFRHCLHRMAQTGLLAPYGRANRNWLLSHATRKVLEDHKRTHGGATDGNRRINLDFRPAHRSIDPDLPEITVRREFKPLPDVPQDAPRVGRPPARKLVRI